MGGIFWAMVLDWAIIEVGFCVGVGLAIVATVLYVRHAARRIRAARGMQPGIQPSSSD
jgi:hypothetical protein